MCPVLLKFLVDVVGPTGVCPAEVKSGVALCSVVMTLHGINRGVFLEPARLSSEIRAHVRAYREAYGTDGWIPKHHFSQHLPEMLARHQTLIACFTHERKHKVIKRYAQHHHNTNSLEKGLVEEITVQHLRDLETCPESGSACAQGDVVLLQVGADARVGELVSLARSGAGQLACVSLWEQDGPRSERSARYRVVSRPQRVDAACLQAALIYSRSQDFATVIFP